MASRKDAAASCNLTLLFQYGTQRVVRLGVIGLGLDGGAQLIGGLVELACCQKVTPSV
jgi:hypothetical protein